eukprot:1354087-Alexandrium_andersonii.AAC.1
MWCTLFGKCVWRALRVVVLHRMQGGGLSGYPALVAWAASRARSVRSARHARGVPTRCNVCMQLGRWVRLV